ADAQAGGSVVRKLRGPLAARRVDHLIAEIDARRTQHNAGRRGDNRAIHIGRDFGLGQGARVHPDFVDLAAEIKASRSAAQIDVDVCWKGLRGTDRADQSAVVQDAVYVNVERPSACVVYTGDVVPGVQVDDRLAVSLDM